MRAVDDLHADCHVVIERLDVRHERDWQRFCDEQDKRRSAERHLNIWRPFAITMIVWELLQFVIGWWVGP